MTYGAIALLLLALNGIWPEPNPRPSNKDSERLAKKLTCLMKAMQVLLEGDNLDTVVSVTRVIQGALVLQKYYSQIGEQLKGLDFTKLPPSVQIWRLLAHIEDQHYLTRKEILKLAYGQGHHDPYVARGSLLGNPQDGSRKAYGENLDALCESAELAIRFILHGKEKPALPVRSEVKSPYEDPDYEQLLSLASTWRLVGDAWANLKYRQWNWDTYKGRDDLCAPLDPTEMIREHAGAIRYNIFVEQNILKAVSKRRRADVGATSEHAVSSINESIVSPTWDGSIDIPALKYLCENSDFQIYCEEYIEARHYGPLLAKLTVAGIGWKSWFGGSNALRVLAEVLDTKLSTTVSEDDVDAPLKRVPIISREILKRLITDCAPLSEDEAERFLDAVRFDPKRKNLEIWSQPLIPCADESFFFAPRLVSSGNAARSIENFVDEWGEASFDSRGVPFEKYVVAELRKRTDGNVEHGIKIPREGEKELEFDILFYWKGHLFLIEAKCSKSIFSGADYFRAKGQIDKSISQLGIRRGALEAIWGELRSHAPALGLPDKFPGADKVHCISVTNVMEFTGRQEDGIVVTDDSCLFRFFDEAVVRQIAVGASGEEPRSIVGRIRDNDEATPEELMHYLADPISMKIFIENMKPAIFAVRPISADTRGFWFAYPEYNPPEQTADATLPTSE